jgi:hypothetical protein
LHVLCDAEQHSGLLRLLLGGTIRDVSSKRRQPLRRSSRPGCAAICYHLKFESLAISLQSPPVLDTFIFVYAA